MKKTIETLSRAKNAKDAKMNNSKQLLSPHAGREQGEGLSAGVFALTAIAASLLLAQPLYAQVVDPDCTGTNPGIVNCTATTYANGITHTTNGDLTVNSGNGVTSYGTGGFITTATGDADITMSKGTGTLSNNATTGTRAPVIMGAMTQSGDIVINAAGTVRAANVSASFTGAQYGINAESTGGGNIRIASEGVLVANGAPGLAAIRAVTNGGDISLNLNGSLSGTVGALLQTTGSGTITINPDRPVIFNPGVDTQHIFATTQAGDITATGARGTFVSTTGNIILNATGSGNLASAGTALSAGASITTETAGLVTINLANYYRTGSSSSFPSVSLRSRGSGSVTVNTAANPDFDLFGGVPPGSGFGVGSGLGQIRTLVSSSFDFTQLGGGATVTFERGTAWFLVDPNAIQFAAASNPTIANAPINRLSAADDVVTIQRGGIMSTYGLMSGSGDNYGVIPNAAEMQALRNGPASGLRIRADFDGGDDVLNLAGDLMVGTMNNAQEASFLDLGFFEMRLENLETFNHAGTIWLGSRFGAVGTGASNNFTGLTDNRADDILSLPGTHFVGMLDEEGLALGRIRADANLGQIGQPGCGTEFRGDDKSLPVTDCLDLRGGHATGRTLVILNQRIPGDRGAYNPDGSVIVDVRGDGASDTDPHAFGIAPESSQYGLLADGTGIIDKGLFFYTIQYDADDQQYKLYGLLGDGAQQFPLLTTSANRLWQRATGSWFERQVDQRDLAKETEVGTGLWFRSSVASTDRDLITPIAAGSQTLSFDNSYTQDEVTTTFGWDWIGRSNEEGALVAGVMLGYARSKLDYTAGANTANLEGMHAGVYASLTRGAFYLDGAIAQTWLDVQNDIPAMELTPATALLDTRAKSLGGRLEGGWRIPVGPVQIEPLAGLSWVKTNLEDMRVPAGDETRIGGDVRFKGVSNNNVSYGLRLSMDNLLPTIMPTGVSLSARQIEEVHGRSEVVVNNIGPIPAVSADELDGTFTQITGSLSLSNVTRTLAGYLNVDSLFGNDVSSLGFSAGVRYEW